MFSSSIVTQVNQVRSLLLVVLLMVVQMIAFVWYVITYIPFGTTMASGTFRTLVSAALQ